MRRLLPLTGAAFGFNMAAGGFVEKMNINKMRTEMDAWIVKSFVRTLIDLKRENPSGFARTVELGAKEKLTVDEGVELLELLLLKNATGENIEMAKAMIAGFRWNASPEMERLAASLNEIRNKPLGYLFLTCSYIEHLSGDGIVACGVINNFRRFLPLIVKNGKITNPGLLSCKLANL